MSSGDAFFSVFQSFFKKPLFLVDFRFSFGKPIQSITYGCKAAKILALLRDSSNDHDAVIPRWSSGYLEPLQAIYHTQATTRAALLSIQEGNYRLRNMISHLEDVKYIPTTILTQYDPNLRTFFNINQVDDLQDIRHLLAGESTRQGIGDSSL